MSARHIVSVLFAVVALGTGWIAYDDDFGRPTKLVGGTEEFRTILPPPIADFSLCDGPIRVNCVVDGDTFWFGGEKIRIADIDAPEIFEPRCSAEKQAGEAARNRLMMVLNAGRFSLRYGWRDEDFYGRKLRNVMRSGRSLGETLVEEGLARRWDGPRWSWCEHEAARSENRIDPR